MSLAAMLGALALACGVVAVARPRWWRGFVALLDHREPGTSLALVRAALGACVLITVWSVVRVGLVDVLWVDRAYGGYRDLGQGSWVTALLGGPTPAVVHALVAAALTGGAATMVGLGGRLAPLIALTALRGLVDTNGHAGGSYDELLSNGLWLLVLAPSTATLSVDCRLRTGRWRDDRPVVAWPRYLVIYQLVLMYWTTGLQKVSAHWTPGGDLSALYYIFQQVTWQRFDLSFFARVYPLTQAATLITWLWEVFAPLLLVLFWLRRTRGPEFWTNRLDLRTWFVVLGLCVHLTLFAVMDVGPFTPITLAFYLALYSPDEFAAAWRRAVPRAA